MAITWPFHDKRALEKAQILMRSLGYDTWIHKRDDYDCYELIIGWPDKVELSKGQLPQLLLHNRHSTSKDN